MTMTDVFDSTTGPAVTDPKQLHENVLSQMDTPLMEDPAAPFEVICNILPEKKEIQMIIQPKDIVNQIESDSSEEEGPDSAHTAQVDVSVMPPAEELEDGHSLVSAHWDEAPAEFEVVTVEPDTRVEVKVLKPYERYTQLQRTFVLSIMILASYTSIAGNSIYLPSLQTIRQEFQTTETITTLSITLYFVGLALGPLFIAPISDHYGRKPIMIFCMSVAGAASLALGFTNTIPWLLGFRLAQSIGFSAPNVVGNGIVVDMYPPEKRSSAVAVFLIAQLIAPVTCPLIGGQLAGAFGWRLLFFVLAVVCGIVLVAVIFVMPETLPKEGRRKGIPRPWRAFVLLTQPRVAIACVAYGLSFFGFYGSFILFPLRLAGYYGLSPGMIGVCFLAMGVGFLGGPIVGGKHADYRYRKTGFLHARLEPALISLPILVVVQLVYGWTLVLHIVAPLITSAFLSALVAYNGPPLTAFVISTNPGEASVASSVVTLVQYGLGAAAAAVTPLADTALGAGPTLTITVAGTVLIYTPLVLLYRHERKVALRKQREQKQLEQEQEQQQQQQQEQKEQELQEMESKVPDDELANAATEETSSTVQPTEV